ncbi:unnamed protein product, partial [Prorocentrum cordatum]
DEIEEAKKLEIKRLEDFGAFQVAPTEASKGKRVIATKWHLTWKAEEKITRARFVVREFAKFAKRFDVFAPASTATTSKVMNFIAMQLFLLTFCFDFSSAFFNAPENEECSVHPPAEWIKKEVEEGRKPTASEEFRQELHHINMVKTSGPVKHGEEYVHLKRFRTCTRDEVAFRSDPRHVTSARKALGMENRGSQPTLGVKANKKSSEDRVESDGKEVTIFRSCAGSLLHEPLDRSDVQHEIGELTAMRSKPTVFDMKALKRLARHVAGAGE